MTKKFQNVQIIVNFCKRLEVRKVTPSLINKLIHYYSPVDHLVAATNLNLNPQHKGRHNYNAAINKLQMSDIQDQFSSGCLMVLT